MNQDQIEKVESFFKSNVPENTEIINIMTVLNNHKGNKEAKYLTHVMVKDLKTGLETNISFNTLKHYRELLKRERYAHLTLTPDHTNE